MGQPKKPVGGAYGAFLTEKRAEFTKALQGKPISEVTKMAGEAWKKLSDAEKAPFQKTYEEAKTKFELDMAAFIDAGGVKTKGALALRREKRKAKEDGGKVKRAKKDENAPKRPAGGAYGCFVAANRPAFQKECPGSITGVAKIAGQKWKALSPVDKVQFEKEYEAKKVAYEEAMKAYVPPVLAEPDEDGQGASISPAAEKKAAKEAKVMAKELKKADQVAKKEAVAAKKAAGKSTTVKAGARGRVAAKAAEPEVSIPKDVLEMASKVGMAEVLKKLIARPDIKAAEIAPQDVFAALEKSGGLLHPARHTLLAGMAVAGA